MRVTTLLAILITGFALHAQNTIYSLAIGNWRNGPVVYITPVIETTEAFTTPQLIARYRSEFAELKDIQDLDVLRFGTREEGEESRTTLKGKYLRRALEVLMIEAAKASPAEEPKD